MAKHFASSPQPERQPKGATSGAPLGSERSLGSQEALEARKLEQRLQPGAPVEPEGPAAGEHRGRHPWAVAYVALSLGALASLGLLIPVIPTDPTAELQDLSPAPQLIQDGHPNVGVLASAGDWFDDHFAFRQPLISANARLQAALFGVSATSQVVMGKDGYLYYAGTIEDYQRTNVMSEAMAQNAAFNLSLMQGYVEGHGAKFVLAVCPNKNSLYPQFMPFWRPAGVGKSSLEVFNRAASAAGVHCVDLTRALSEASELEDDGVLYMKTDTHWDGEGAQVGYEAIMEALGLAPKAMGEGELTTNTSFVGDLEAMLYPFAPTPEPLTLPDAALDFAYQGEAQNVEDNYLVTQAQNPSEHSSLLMYRDSFGNVLLPYFASTFERACFSKLVPYDLSQLESLGANVVVVERAERHIAFFATDPPAMAAPRLAEAPSDPVPVEGVAATLSAKENGPYYQIEGVVSGLAPQDVGRIVLVVTQPTGERAAYVAFRQSIQGASGYDNGGYRLYLPKEALGSPDAEIAIVGEGLNTNTPISLAQGQVLEVLS